MKIALLQIDDKKNPNVYGDFAGGFGAGFTPGKNLLSKAVGYAKHHGLDLPLMNFGYLSGIFQQAGHEVISGRNTYPKVDLTIIHSSLTGWKEQIFQAKKIKENGDGKVGFIGPFSSVKHELFLEASHFVISGEPEKAAIRLANGENLEGLIQSKPIKKLETLPFPDWTPFNFIKFTYFPSLLHKPIFPIQASRGCPDNCDYCPYKVLYKNFRARPVEDVIAEIEKLIVNYNAAGFLFRDPFFTFSRKRTEKFAKLLIKKEISKPWVCETKIESLDEELLLLLQKAGLRTVNVGIESVVPNILRKAGRKVFDKQRVHQLIRFCDKIGVKVAGFFILGWLEDTPESIEATINYAVELNPHIATFTIFTPFPGTGSFERLKSQITTSDWSKFDVMNSVFNHPTFTAEQLLAYKEKAYLKFYYRPRYISSFFRRILRK